MSDPTKEPDSPRLKIVLTQEGLSALLKSVHAQPVATGEGAEVSKAVTTGDRFRDCYCLKCGDHGALYCFEGGHVSLCSHCTIERIEKLAGAGRELPPTVLWLYWEAERELKAQAKREREKLSVRFNDIYRCYRCAGLVREKEVRYWGREGENVLYPFCGECREVLASGREEFQGREQTEFDFDV